MSAQIQAAESDPDPGIPEDLGAGWGNYLLASAEQMVILVGIYIFSIGPMYWKWLEAKQVDGVHMVAVLYEPLWRLAGLIPAFGEWLNWYVRLWIFAF